MALFKRTAAIDVELKSNEVLRVRDLRVQFQVEKTKDSTANKAEIKITNLSQETRNKIREKDALIRVFAGYEGDIGEVLLFSGNSQHIVNNWETPDIITNIEAQDGQRQLRETRVSFSYGNRTNANTILNRLANEIGLPLRQDFNVQGNYQGYSFNGRARDGMDEVCRRFNHTWSIQDGEILIVPREGNTGRLATVLSPTTGLVNTPERLSDQEGKFDEAIEKSLEWKLTSLLNPRLSCGALVQLESRQANGLFQIEKVRHYGDTRGQEWYSEIEVKGAS